jgi:hypothetical protein
VKSPVIAVNMFDIDKLPQILEVAELDELPATKLPSSTTRNVDDPTEFLV